MNDIKNEMKTKKTLEWDNKDPELSLTLPSRYFFDPIIFEKETEKIFYPSWHFVCHKSEISNIGDFIKFDILKESILVIRAPDGSVNAMHNVCRHRGTQLIQKRRGNTKDMLICPYHAWSYNLDGSLRYAPRSETMKNFSKKDWGLSEVLIEEFAGFYFVNFDKKASPLSDDIPGAYEAMRPYFPDLKDIKFIEEVDMLVDANWKVIVDNAIEGYHFKLSGPHHKDLAALIDFDKYELNAHGKWWDFKGPPVPTRKAFGETIEGQAYQTDWFYNIQIWPMTTIYAFPYADAIGTFNEIPIGPEKTLLRFGHYIPQNRAQNKLSKAAIKWFNEKLGPEDIDLNLYVQRGLHSSGFDQGRYMIDAERSSNSEHLLHHFHSLVYRALHGGDKK